MVVPTCRHSREFERELGAGTRIPTGIAVDRRSGPPFALESFGLDTGVEHGVTGMAIAEERQDYAGRMAAVARLADGVASDVGELIAVADQAVRSALTDTRMSGVAGTLGTAAGSLQRAMLIVRQLELFAGKTSPRMLPRRFDDAIAEVMPLVRRLAGSGVTVEEQSGDLDVELMMPAGAIEQVVMHLVVNARDAMPDGGTLTFRAGIDSVDHPVVHRFGIIGRGRWARITIADTGPGIAPSVVERLFEPFCTTKPSGSGSGLGLATVRSVISQCSGQITMETSPRGSSFGVWFPVRGIAAVESTARTATVLVADEDPWTRAAARRLLRRAGYGVLEAADAETLVEIINGVAGPAIDIILLDRHLPGLEAARIDLSPAGETSGPAIVFMSEQGERQPGWLAKPLGHAELIARVEAEVS